MKDDQATQAVGAPLERHVRPLAEAFHPGAFIREELEARGWTTATLAQKAQLQEFVVQELCAEHRKVTPIMARCLGNAFGTGHEVWMNLQRSFDAA